MTASRRARSLGDPALEPAVLEDVEVKLSPPTLPRSDDLNR